MVIDGTGAREQFDGAAVAVTSSDGTTGIFDSLPDDSRAQFEARMTELAAAAGDIIFREGDPGDALFLVRSGLVDIVTGPGVDERLVTFGPGELFGEMALLTGRPRNATARAQTDAVLWRLDHADFLVQLGHDPALAKIVAQGLSQRLRASTEHERGTRRGRTVVVHGSDPRRAAAFVTGLLASCAPFVDDPAIVLACGDEPEWHDSPLTPTVLDPDDVAGAAVRDVREHSLVVVLCGRSTPPAALVDGADWYFTIDGPAPARAHPRAARTIPSLGDVDVDAIAREICGRRVGLALGAGGIRGWAHAGVFEVLDREGIPIDFVSGASAGSVAGAVYVAGMPPEEMLQIPSIARDVLWAMARSYRPSPLAILSDRPFVRYLRDRLGADTRIEDLPKPLYVAVTDVETRKAVYISTGPLAEAVVASAALNGIFPPITIDGRTYIDGGTADAVPVGILRDAGADIVIAVNVMAVGDGASGFIPRGKLPMPPFVDNLLVGLDTVISKGAEHSCKLADVIIEPEHAGGRWFELLPAARYAGAGARATEAALPKIRSLLGRGPVAPVVAAP